MKCPRDQTALEARTYESDIEVDSCASCGGMWLDKGELEAIQQTKERDHRRVRERDPVARAINAVAQLEAGPIKCPKCDGEMDTRDYGYGSQVVIDTCPNDCGVWLDVGEVEALERLYEKSHAEADDVLPLRLKLWVRLYEVFGKKAEKRP